MSSIPPIHHVNKPVTVNDNDTDGPASGTAPNQLSRGGNTTSPPTNQSPLPTAPLPHPHPRPSTQNGGPSTPAPAPAPTSTPTPTPAFPGQVDALPGPGPASTWQREQAARKRRWSMLGYGEEEAAWMEEGVMGLHAALAIDQYSTLYPPPPTAFSSYEDVVDRLLPYHVWQVYDEELEGYKVSEKEAARERREAHDTVTRIRGIKERFAKTRRKEGNHPSSLAPLISMYNDQMPGWRDEVTALKSVLRPIETEYNALLSEAKRVEEERVRAEQRIRMEAERKKAEEERRKREEEERARRPPTPVSVPIQNTKAPIPALNGQPGYTLTQPNRPAQQPTPVAGGTPVRPSPSTPAAATPTAGTGTGTPADRGRPRGRPRGRGRGGTREPAVSHIANVNGSAGGTTSAAPSAAAQGSAATHTPSPGVKAAVPPTPTPPPAGAVGRPSSNPVSLTVSIGLVPQLVSLGILPNPSAPGAKTPASLFRTAEDKKSVSMLINLQSCTKPQLMSLAKLLNIAPTKPLAQGAAAAAAAAAPGGSSTGGSASGAGSSANAQGSSG